MAAMSRNKGKTGEREIAAILADLTGCRVQRRVCQRDGDSDLEGLPGWCVEVKRHARATRASVATWWRQAVAQAEAAGGIPVLFWRQDRDEWRAVWPVATTLAMQRADMWTAYEWTAEGSIEAWAAIHRDLLVSPRPVAEIVTTARESMPVTVCRATPTATNWRASDF